MPNIQKGDTKMTKPTLPALLSAREVADHLGLHLNTVYEYLNAGLIKGFKLGGNKSSNHRWRVRASDLAEFTTPTTRAREENGK